MARYPYPDMLQTAAAFERNPHDCQRDNALSRARFRSQLHVAITVILRTVFRRYPSDVSKSSWTDSGSDCSDPRIGRIFSGARERLEQR